MSIIILKLLKLFTSFCESKWVPDPQERSVVTPLIWPSGLAVVGPLTGGGLPMSPVDFKKWQCHMSLPLIYARVACQI